MIARLVSGGQTGVDRAALDVALELGIPCGGWCPKGRRAEDGRIPDRYPLTETPGKDYPTRTRWNVRDSDFTLVLTEGEATGGTLLTVQAAQAKGGRMQSWTWAKRADSTPSCRGCKGNWPTCGC